MRKILLTVYSLLSFLFLVPQIYYVYAQSLCPPGGSNFANLCNVSFNTTIVGKVVNILMIIAVILSLFFLIWGGIRWIMSGGDKAKVDQARATLTAAVIGLVVTLLAYFILNIVLGLFRINLNNINLNNFCLTC